jgi:hypothetical protein
LSTMNRADAIPISSPPRRAEVGSKMAITYLRLS